MIFPQDLYKTLEFDRLLEIVQSYCLGSTGAAHFDNPPLYTEAEPLRRVLLEINEYKRLSDKGSRLPISSYPDLTQEIRMLAIEGYVLTEESLAGIAVQLRVTRDIFRWFRTSKDAADLAPNLFNIIRDIQFDEDLLKQIDRVIDAEGHIRPDASPELSRLRRAKLARLRDCDREFKSVVNKYSSKGWLADTVETVRNGRRVLSVPSEHKRGIRGIIHDESDSGRVAYIEPEEVIDINNDIFDFDQAEKREIFRILRELSATLRPYTRFFSLYQDILTRYDIVQAKANFADRVQGTMPEITDEPQFYMRKVIHPLLYMKNQRDGKKKTVPFNLELHEGTHIVLLSGPNAGGKSICMKAIGLVQLMLQSGLLVPAEDGAKMGLFNQFFADIGDQQSLDDELSTYSSRLRNAKYFLDHATPKTLVLIDEFGSGTDPKAGGAIAEALLKELLEKKSWGVITTHYSTLKLFAYRNKGIVNAAMVFDKTNLSPTYKMAIGKPGSSYAFEIGQKSGLSPELLDFAAKRMGEAEKNFDDLLVNLQKEKQETVEARIALLEERKQLSILIKNYEGLSRELEIARKRLKAEVKELALRETQQMNKDLQKVLRELRETENTKEAAEKAKNLLFAQQEEQRKLQENVDSLRSDIDRRMDEKVTGKIKEGSEVKLRGSSTTGLVESIKGKDAVVIVGNMRLNMKIRDLEELVTAIEKPQVVTVSTNMITRQTHFDAKLDIRGMRHEEALAMIEGFMDRALMSNSNMLEIIHGKGTGVLKQVVRQKLRTYRDIKNVRSAEDYQGGDGVTIVEL